MKAHLVRSWELGAGSIPVDSPQLLAPSFQPRGGFKTAPSSSRASRRWRAQIEEEARFLVEDPAVHQALAGLRSLDGFRVVKRHREQQRNSYLDTEDWRLRRARSVLKLRQVGKHAEVTFKRSFGYRHGVAKRLEVTTLIRPGQTRLLRQGRLDIEPVRRARAVAGERPFRPLLTLWTDRRSLILAFQRHRIELDIDRVTWRKGRRILAARLELEVENLNATPAVFNRVLLALRRQFGTRLRPTRVSKFEFGLRLVLAASPNPTPHLTGPRYL